MGRNTGKPSLRPLWLLVAGFFAAWTAWAALLARGPPALAGDGPLSAAIRTGVRLALWLGPAALFVHGVEHRPLLEALRLWPGALHGAAAGLGVATLWLGQVVAFRLSAGAHLRPSELRRG